MAEVAADLELVGNGGEQRPVTLMFADISGSTALVQHLQPEEAADLLNPLVQAMTEAIERYRGTVSPRGDGVLAIFGVPGSAEDNAVRACVAALDILAAMPAAEGAPRVRIGIHHGEVALLPAGGGRRKTNRPTDYDAFGPAVHIAARLEQTAEPGSACLSAEANALVKDFVETRPLPAINLKGFADEVERVQLLSLRSGNRWQARVARGLTPFVGRREELAVISRWLDEGPGNARLLQIQGPAGIGKSRLIHEALRSEPTGRSCRIVLSGPVHRGFTGYDPIATWLRELARTLGAQPDRVTADGIIGALQHVAPFSTEQAEQLVRYLGLTSSRGVRVADLSSEKRLPVAPQIGAIMAGLAGDRRVLLCCEDAETFDAATLALLTAIVTELSRRSVPLLLLVTSRRPLRFAGDVFAERRTIPLRPLSLEAARQLLARVNPMFRQGGHADRIIAKADGNPLYLEEVAALMLNRGADIDGFDEFVIPNEIEALIADRIARLPQQLQTLLRSCAVVGAEFSPDLLAAVVGGRADSVSQQLSRLQTEHLLDGRPNHASGTPRLAFRHALLRDVAYKTLLPSRRRRLHARIVELLEPSIEAAPQRLDELCHHAVRAQLWQPALGFLQRAAVAAAERTAHATAERHLRKALEIAQSLPPDHQTRATAVDIMIGLRTLLALELRYEEADRLLDQAQKIAEDQTAGALSPDIRLSILVKRVHVLNSLGRVREATAVASEAHRTAVSIGNLALRLSAAHFLGQTCFYAGRYRQGEAVLSDSIALLPDYVDTGSVRSGSWPVLIHATRGGIRGFMGRFDGAESDCRQALAIATGEHRPYDVAFTHLSAGMVRLQRRQIAQAEATFRSGLEAAERHELKALLPSLKAGLGQSLLLAGSTNAAIDALSDAYETAKTRGRLLIHMWAAIGLAAAYGSAGGLAPGLRHAEEAVQIGTHHTLRGYLVAALRCKGVLLAMHADMRAEGMRVIRQALGLARKLGTEPDIAACLAALHVVSGNGDPEAALEARNRFTALGMGAWADTVLSADPPAVAAF